MSAASRPRPPGEDSTATRPAALPPAVAGGFRLAIAAAAERIGATAPNPPVGCAILDRAGTVLAVAAHQQAGAPHAEALALRQLAERGVTDRAATMLVTLEPCTHVGRTGPCADAILRSPIGEVWIGALDPNPLAAGGAGRLRAAGRTVHRLDGAGADAEAAGLARQCAALIAPFNRRNRDGRPWITVKQAFDPAGGMIPPAGTTTFTRPASLLLAHRLRRCTDAVITGIGTVLADRPALTVRHLPDHPGRHPRVLAILDRENRLPADYRAAAVARGFDVRIVRDLDDLPAMLGAAGVLWAMVEAGPRLLHALRARRLWDDWLTISAGEDADRLGVELADPAGSPTPLSLLPELEWRP